MSHDRARAHALSSSLKKKVTERERTEKRTEYAHADAANENQDLINKNRQNPITETKDNGRRIGK